MNWNKAQDSSPLRTTMSSFTLISVGRTNKLQKYLGIFPLYPNEFQQILVG